VREFIMDRECQVKELALKSTVQWKRPHGTQALVLYLYYADSFFGSGDAKSTATNETDRHLLLVAKELYIEDAEVKDKKAEDSKR
jgi:hypothetical protein